MINKIIKKVIAKLDKQDKEKMKQELLDIKEQLLKENKRYKDYKRQDNPQGVFDHLLKRNEAMLSDIEESLSKMESENYGKCERCGGSVGKHTLLRNPKQKYCFNCLEKLKQI